MRRAQPGAQPDTGSRPDDRGQGLQNLFNELFPLCSKKGARGCVTGQGELKRLANDPLFSLNHTCAMFRAWVNRLFRRTWNTTKKVERLEHHLHIYAYFHNLWLPETAEKEKQEKGPVNVKQNSLCIPSP